MYLKKKKTFFNALLPMYYLIFNTVAGDPECYLGRSTSKKKR